MTRSTATSAAGASSDTTDDPVYVGILQALDELHGVSWVRKGPWRVTTHHLIPQLAREPWFVESFPQIFDRPVDWTDQRSLEHALRRVLRPKRRRT